MHWLADLVLTAHFALVLFITGGLPLIWLGAAASWRWVRNFKFRVAHLAAICFVAGEALIGVTCPLTTWEHALRGAPAERTFIARWLHRLLFYSFPDWVFTTVYVAFALMIAATWWYVRPRRT